MIKIFTINFKERYNKTIGDHSVEKNLEGHVVVVLNENIKQNSHSIKKTLTFRWTNSTEGQALLPPGHRGDTGFMK